MLWPRDQKKRRIWERECLPRRLLPRIRNEQSSTYAKCTPCNLVPRVDDPQIVRHADLGQHQSPVSRYRGDFLADEVWLFSNTSCNLLPIASNCNCCSTIGLVLTMPVKKKSGKSKYVTAVLTFDFPQCSLLIVPACSACLHVACLCKREVLVNLSLMFHLLDLEVKRKEQRKSRSQRKSLPR